MTYFSWSDKNTSAVELCTISLIFSDAKCFEEEYLLILSLRNFKKKFKVLVKSFACVHLGYVFIFAFNYKIVILFFLDSNICTRGGVIVLISSLQIFGNKDILKMR